MGIKAVLTEEAFGELDDNLQSLYVQAKDGRYVIDVEGVDALPSVQGLVSTLNKYKEAAPSAHGLKQKLEKLSALEALEGLGDPDEIREKMERLEELEAAGGGKSAEELRKELSDLYDGRIAKVSEKHQKELDKRAEEIAKRDRFIERLTVDNQLDAALSKLDDGKGVIPQTQKAVKALLKTDYKPRVVQDGDDYRAVVDTDMGELALADFVETWGRSEDAAPFLHASGNRGSGAKNGTGGAHGRKNPWSKEHFNLTEQMKITSENPALAESLKAAA